MKAVPCTRKQLQCFCCLLQVLRHLGTLPALGVRAAASPGPPSAAPPPLLPLPGCCCCGPAQPAKLAPLRGLLPAPWWYPADIRAGAGRGLRWGEGARMLPGLTGDPMGEWGREGDRGGPAAGAVRGQSLDIASKPPQDVFRTSAGCRGTLDVIVAATHACAVCMCSTPSLDARWPSQLPAADPR